jgi:hypothetical protein
MSIEQANKVREIERWRERFAAERERRDMEHQEHIAELRRRIEELEKMRGGGHGKPR